MNNQCGSKMDSAQENLRRELYFLIAKLLMSSPCQRSAKALLEELSEYGLLCQRLDWKGNYHPQTFQETVNQNTHISNDFLVQICSRIGPLLQKCVPSSVRGVRSLLGAGRQSLLRNGSETVRPTSLSLAASHNDAPLLPPSDGKRLCPNLAQSIISREISGFKNKRLLAQPNTYSKQTMHRRILGHLSAVYCVLFDRTGRCMITGADDSLVKIWSTRDGRLLATLRGHQAEITDIAINCENTLVAAGSCDKIIRVWSLKTTYPVAILQGHTGMITSLAFCPSPLKESRYLMSTGADGTVCFWKWEATNLTFDVVPVRFMEKTRPGTQMVCSSFSPGGSFLVAGSTDHIIRLYQMTPGPPEKMAELDVHTDHVDSIQFSHNGEKFLSGSKDGTARIWYFRRSKWENILLDISKTLSNTPILDEFNKSNKPRVTMVSWDLCDHHVLTAINDHSIKVWDSSNGTLVHVLEGHLDELFVLEAHPIDPHVFLSAGHDGFVILWDLRTGKKITTFFNSIEGQGHGAVFDCKFSPDGMQFACTDSHGHLCVFGYGSSEPFAKVPSEQFFHTDYRPLIRDANHYVLDEQTQTAPHLMPPPFLVDVDGNPHPLHYQRLVPGHGSNVRNAPQPPPPPTPRAEIAPFLAEIEEAENRGRAAVQVPPGSPPHQGAALQPPLQSPGGSRNYGMRQSGDVEGVRQAQGNVPVIEDVAESDIALWRKRTIVPDRKPSAIKFDEERRLYLGRSELTNYLREKKKRPQATAAVRLVNQSIQESLSNSDRSQRNQRRTSSRQAARARSRATRVQRVANRVTSRPTYSTRATLAMEMDESGDEDVVVLTPTDSEEEEEEWTGSSSESSEYSDWTEDAGIRSQAQSENRRTRRVRRVFSTSDEEGDVNQPSSSSPQQSSRSRKDKTNKKPPKPKKIPKKPKLDEVQDILNYYQPPDWLTCTKPRLSPYLPQIGDEVYYFRQGHEVYVKEVMKHKLYDINPKKQCYYKLRLKSEELCRIVSLHVSLCNEHPPTLCCLKLAQINPETGCSTGGSFTVKYHDMPDVLDFIILRQYYDRSLLRNWQPGDRFRSVIDESWWAGEITERSPYQPEHPESHFQCLEVRWDTGEVERMSPWDLQPVNQPGNQEQDASEDGSSNMALSDEELQALSYEPSETDWLGEGREQMTQRIMSSMEALCQLSMAGPFVYPVDVQAYPDYWSIVPFPNDLSTIIQKLQNKFYRRANALIWEIKILERNARLYNEEDSQIVRNATRLVRVLTDFIRDSECQDILSLCDGINEEEGEEIEVTHMSEESNNEEAEEEGPNDRGKRKKSEKRKPNKRLKREEPEPEEEEEEPSEETWISSARTLLHFLMSREDAEPFQSPVNLRELPDYTEFVQEPMDFSTVSEKLDNGLYADPDAFVRDVRLIFSNSRAYNTIPRSRIYSMTIRLSAMFEDRVDSILSEWYASASGGARRTRLRTQRLLQTGASTDQETTSWQVVNPSNSRGLNSDNTDDSSGYSVVRQASNHGDRLRTTIRLPQSRQSVRNTISNASASAGRVPPIRIRTVAETSPRQETSPPERRRATRQAMPCETATRTTRNRSTPRNEVLVNGEATTSHQYSTRRSTRLMSEESQVAAAVAEEEEDEDDEEDDEEEEEEEATQDSEDEGGEDDGEDEEEEEESEDDSEEESEESEEESPTDSRPSRRTNVRPKMRPTAVPAKKSSSRADRNTQNIRSNSKSSSTSTSRSRGDKRRLSSSTSTEIDSAQRHSTRVRSRPRHLTYAESDSDSENETMNISSRGRLRRPTQRMLDYVE